MEQKFEKTFRGVLVRTPGTANDTLNVANIEERESVLVMMPSNTLALLNSEAYNGATVTVSIVYDDDHKIKLDQIR